MIKVKKEVSSVHLIKRMFKSNAQKLRADSLSFNETDGELHLNREPILWSGRNK